MTDETPTLEQRVADLEEAVDLLTRRTRGFLRDCRVDTFRNIAETSYRITHLPTGVRAEGGWDEAVAQLGRELVQRGDITINAARAAHGLPEMSLEGD